MPVPQEADRKIPILYQVRINSYITTAKAIRTKTRGLSPLLTNLHYLRNVLTALATAIIPLYLANFFLP